MRWRQNRAQDAARRFRGRAEAGRARGAGPLPCGLRSPMRRAKARAAAARARCAWRPTPPNGAMRSPRGAASPCWRSARTTRPSPPSTRPSPLRRPGASAMSVTAAKIGVLANLGQRREAVELFEQSLAQNALSTLPALDVAYLGVRVGNDEVARDRFAKAQADGALTPSAALDAAYVSKRLAQNEQALAYFRDAIDATVGGTLRMPAQKLFDVRREVAEIERRWGAYTTLQLQRRGRGAGHAAGAAGGDGQRAAGRLRSLLAAAGHRLPQRPDRRAVRPHLPDPGRRKRRPDRHIDPAGRGRRALETALGRQSDRGRRPPVRARHVRPQRLVDPRRGLARRRNRSARRGGELDDVAGLRRVRPLLP